MYRMIVTPHYAVKRHTQSISSQLLTEHWQPSLAGTFSKYNGILKRIVSEYVALAL